MTEHTTTSATDSGTLSTGDAALFRPDPGAAPLWRMVLAQAGMELRIMLRHGEQLLLTMVIPVLLLVGFTVTPVLDMGEGARVALAQLGITVHAGVQGSADEAVRALLAGTLQATASATCDHHGHEHGHHDCNGHHGHEHGHHDCGGHCHG